MNKRPLRRGSRVAFKGRIKGCCFFKIKWGTFKMSLTLNFKFLIFACTKGCFVHCGQLVSEDGKPKGTILSKRENPELTPG